MMDDLIEFIDKTYYLDFIKIFLLFRLSIKQTRGLNNYLMLAETFNKNFKISSWVIHCEVRFKPFHDK